MRNKLMFAMMILASGLLIGCGGKSEEAAPVSTAPNPTASAPTSNQMPPEVKARMDAQQAEMKARAEAQGKAMMSNSAINQGK
jgi:hypothetical protein